MIGEPGLATLSDLLDATVDAWIAGKDALAAGCMTVASKRFGSDEDRARWHELARADGNVWPVAGCPEADEAVGWDDWRGYPCDYQTGGE